QLLARDGSLEFDDEQVAADVAGVFGIERAGRKIADTSGDRLRSSRGRRLDLLAGQMLAECRQRVGEPAGHEETRRVALDEAYDVAGDKGPQPGATRQRRRIIDTGFDVAYPMPCRVCGADLLGRHELIEDAVVKIDPHAFSLAAVGAGDKAF